MPKENGKPFGLQHCWRVLDHNEKWKERNEEAPSKTRSWNSSSPELDVSEEDDRHGEDRVSRSPTPAYSLGPSDERKRSKEMFKRLGEVEAMRNTS